MATLERKDAKVTAADTPSEGKIGQGLLKRRAGMSHEAFRQYYVEHHGPVALPWCFAMGVKYYAQIHKPLRWANDAVREKYSQTINLEQWDAVAEMLFPVDFDFGKWLTAGSVGKQYFHDVILPDERRFLLSNAMEHLQGVEAGSVVGDRVVLIENGKAAVEYGEWQRLFNVS
ncbi:hypothetical protein B0A48_16283 [Cryoendolithus antarcticus]|uniref:EthD domain-containing protein n=1 Tax=Cryoendolithus antarcticus TaxID=1507870 RepID=A0A1V8SFP0_9PEZI|nr:hypothetical protein B0A48_16283 [Cryoendolithus antarcticus]